MSYEKHSFQTGQRLTASQLNSIDNAVSLPMPSINLVNPSTVSNGYLQSYYPYPYSNYAPYVCTDFIRVEFGRTYSMRVFNADNDGQRTDHGYVLYDNLKTSLNGSYTKEQSTNGLTLTINDKSVSYIRCFARGAKILVAESINSMMDWVDYGTDHYDSVGEILQNNSILDIFGNSRNIISCVPIVENHLYSDTEYASQTYSYFKDIFVQHGKKYVSTYPMRYIVHFKHDGTRLTTVQNASSFSPEQDGYIYVTFENRYIAADLKFYASDELIFNVLDYGEKKQISQKFCDDVYRFIPSTHDVLYGKKWYACGDSFTEWTTETYKLSEYPNIEGLQHYKTYPFFIGVRNKMRVNNIAKSGQTIATPSSGGFTNCFTNGTYQNIPTDTDYITLWFGINDSHHRAGSSGGDGQDNTGVIPLGTIDDNTVNTFYGAWNVVLAYLIEHHPFAKIGIIVSNGCETNDYPNAEIAVAKKWGIPYLDLNGDYSVPLMHRVAGKTEVCEQAHTLRKNAFWADVAGGNGHPNVKAHEYQSTFIENWMRSL